MELIDTTKIKGVKQAREIIETQQNRIWHLENVLDDLARACEIAQYSQQYHLTESFRDAATAALEDRLVQPEIEQTPMKIKVVTGKIDEELNQQISAKAKKAAGIDD